MMVSTPHVLQHTYNLSSDTAIQGTTATALCALLKACHMDSSCLKQVLAQRIIDTAAIQPTV
eukprot:2761965-Rhodomonas_salina.2